MNEQIQKKHYKAMKINEWVFKQQFAHSSNSKLRPFLQPRGVNSHPVCWMKVSAKGFKGSGSPCWIECYFGDIVQAFRTRLWWVFQGLGTPGPAREKTHWVHYHHAKQKSRTSVAPVSIFHLFGRHHFLLLLKRTL